MVNLLTVFHHNHEAGEAIGPAKPSGGRLSRRAMVELSAGVMDARPSWWIHRFVRITMAESWQFRSGGFTWGLKPYGTLKINQADSG